ncbi:MAG: hypothetical protein ABFD96_17450 [Armatimonadia bacterium]
MNTLKTAAILGALLLPLALQAQMLVPGGDFEAPPAGWELSGKASFSKDKPAAGKGALALQSDAATPAWAWSAPLTGVQTGAVVNLSFSLRRPQGAATLGLRLGAGPADASDAFIWQALPPADANWHKISLTLVVPPLPGNASPRLGFAAVGPAGSWQLDDLTLQPDTMPSAAPPTLTGEKAETDLLPDGWQPEGKLDATVKELGSATELLLNVNGIELGVRPDFECYRGYRSGLLIFAVNRGHLEKDLDVRVAAPLGVDAPAWTVPVKQEGTNRFHTAIQSLRQGEYWIKLTFSSAGQQASLPVKVKCLPGYPLIGTIWHDQVNTDQLAALQALPIDLHVLAAPPDLAAYEPMAAQIKSRGMEYMAAPLVGSLTAPQYLAALTQLCGKLTPSYWLPYTTGEALTLGTVTPQFISALRKLQLPPTVFSAPLTIARDWTKDALLPVKSNLVTKDRLAGAVVAVCRLPALAPPCVVAEKLDGSPEAVGGASISLPRQVDLLQTCLLLRERDLNIPVLVDELHAASSGDARLDALYLARIMTKSFTHANTGLILPPQRSVEDAFGLDPVTASDGKPDPLATVVQALSRELGGAAPQAALADTPDASRDGATVITYHPFVRGGEGIVVLWNNTSTPRDVTLEFRGEPVSAQRLLLNYSGDLAVRRWDPIMKFSDEAFKRNQPGVYLRLDPLQVQVHSFRLRSPGADWLRAVSLTKPYVAPKEDATTTRDQRKWWTDMLSNDKQL